MAENLCHSPESGIEHLPQLQGQHDFGCVIALPSDKRSTLLLQFQCLQQFIKTSAMIFDHKKKTARNWNYFCLICQNKIHFTTGTWNWQKVCKWRSWWLPITLPDKGLWMPILSEASAAEPLHTHLQHRNLQSGRSYLKDFYHTNYYNKTNALLAYWDQNLRGTGPWVIPSRNFYSCMSMTYL